jgi:hypothetical protein
MKPVSLTMFAALTTWVTDWAFTAHREATRRSGQTAQNLRFATVEVPASALPLSWREVRRRLAAASAEGRPEAGGAAHSVGRNSP